MCLARCSSEVGVLLLPPAGAALRSGTVPHSLLWLTLQGTREGSSVLLSEAQELFFDLSSS